MTSRTVCWIQYVTTKRVTSRTVCRVQYVTIKGVTSGTVCRVQYVTVKSVTSGTVCRVQYVTIKGVTSGTVCQVQYVTVMSVTLMAQRRRHPSFHVVSRHCCPGSTIAVDAPGIAKVSYSLLRLVFDETPPMDWFGLMGTNIHRVLIYLHGYYYSGNW